MPFIPDMLDITVVGERGQVVIPKKIREALDLKAGSKLLVMHHGDGALILMPAEKMKSLMSDMKERFTMADKLIKSN